MIRSQTPNIVCRHREPQLPLTTHCVVGLCYDRARWQTLMLRRKFYKYFSVSKNAHVDATKMFAHFSFFCLLLLASNIFSLHWRYSDSSTSIENFHRNYSPQKRSYANAYMYRYVSQCHFSCNNRTRCICVQWLVQNTDRMIRRISNQLHISILPSN